MCDARHALQAACIREVSDASQLDSMNNDLACHLSQGHQFQRVLECFNVLIQSSQSPMVVTMCAILVRSDTQTDDVFCRTTTQDQKVRSRCTRVGQCCEAGFSVLRQACSVRLRLMCVQHDLQQSSDKGMESEGHRATAHDAE